MNNDGNLESDSRTEYSPHHERIAPKPFLNYKQFIKIRDENGRGESTANRRSVKCARSCKLPQIAIDFPSSRDEYLHTTLSHTRPLRAQKKAIMVIWQIKSPIGSHRTHSMCVGWGLGSFPCTGLDMIVRGKPAGTSLITEWGNSVFTRWKLLTREARKKLWNN